MSQENSAEDPREFHREMIHRLHNEWAALPDTEIADADYHTGAADAKQNNKYRKAWFNAIAQEVPLIIEDGIVTDTEEAERLLDETRQLAEEVNALMGKVTEDLVSRGDDILEAVEQYL